MNNTPKIYSIIAVVMIILLAVAGFMVFKIFWPNYTQSKNALVLAQANNDSLKKAINGVQTFLANYKVQTASAARVNLALPAGSPDMPDFISSLSDLSAQSGVSLSNFQINAPATDDTITPAQYTIQREDFGVSASGTYPAMKDFLQRVEDHLRLIDIYHVSISTGVQPTGSSGEETLQFDIKIHTYFQQ